MYLTIATWSCCFEWGWMPVYSGKNTSLNLKANQFPRPVHNIIQLCKLITNNCFFSFHKEILQTTNRFTDDGPPISGVLVCMCIYFLVYGPFKHIVPINPTYLRYIRRTSSMYSFNGNLIHYNMHPRIRTWRKMFTFLHYPHFILNHRKRAYKVKKKSKQNWQKNPQIS